MSVLNSVYYLNIFTRVYIGSFTPLYAVSKEARKVNADIGQLNKMGHLRSQDASLPTGQAEFQRSPICEDLRERRDVRLPQGNSFHC